MRAADNHRSGFPKAIVAAVFVSFPFLAGCAPRAGPEDMAAELAELRQEHAAMRAELESLRRQLVENQNGVPPSPDANVPRTRSVDSPSRLLTLVLEAYRESLEAGDLRRLESAVYGGHVPKDDQRLLKTIVERTDGLKLDLNTRKLELRGHRARLVVDHTMDFRLRRTQEQRRARLALVMVFEEGPNGWRLVGIARD